MSLRSHGFLLHRKHTNRLTLHATKTEGEERLRFVGVAATRYALQPKSNHSRVYIATPARTHTRVCAYTHTSLAPDVSVARRNPPFVWRDIARARARAGGLSVRTSVRPCWPSRTVAEKSITRTWCGAASLFQVAACACATKEANLADERVRERTSGRAGKQRASDRARTGENESPARHTLCRGQACDRIPAFRCEARICVRIYTCMHVWTLLRNNSVARGAIIYWGGARTGPVRRKFLWKFWAF